MDFIDHEIVAQTLREHEMTDSLITLQHIYLNFKVFNEGVIRNTPAQVQRTQLYTENNGLKEI